MNRLPNRKSPAHPSPITRLNAPCILFVTVCSKVRTPTFDNGAVEAALRAIWLLSTQWKVGQYVLMPDHIHFFCAPKLASGERVQDWCQFWKSLASRANPELAHCWLPGCWDTQMRSAEHYRIEERYMEQNPVRAGLVDSYDDWPYRGSISKLPW